MAMHIVLGRQLGPDGYGIFAFGLGLGLLLGYVAPLGWQIGITRWLTEYRDKDSPALARGALRRSTQITLTVALVAAAVTAAIGWCFWPATSLRTGFLIGSIIIVVTAQRGLARRQLMGFGKPRLAMFLDDTAVPVGVLGVVLAFPASDAAAALWIYAAVAAVLAGLCLLAVRAARPPAVARAAPTYRTAEWWRTARPLTLANVSRIALNRTDILLLGPLTDAATVGLYSAAHRLSYLMLFAQMVLSTLFSARLANAYYSRNLVHLRRVFLFQWGLSTLPAGLFLFVFFTYGEPLLGFFFGAGFAEASPLLQLLGSAAFVSAATGPTATALAMTERERGLSMSLLTGLALNIVVSVPAILLFGAVGAAAATLLSSLVLNLWQLAIVRRMLQTDAPNWGQL